jgi:uncharacterized UPF0160 family protein
MVLQQLDDHSKVLQNFNKEISDVKQDLAVYEAELKIWRENSMSVINVIKKDLSYVLYDEKGLNHRIAAIERDLDVEEQASNKHKSTWALYGSIIVFLLNIAIQILAIYFKN